MMIDEVSTGQLHEWQNEWFMLYQTSVRFLPNDRPPFTLDEINDELEYRKNHNKE